MLWICFLTALCFEAGWPEFRGGAADGISRIGSIPLEWTEEKNIGWRVDIPGLGWSSPVIENGRIFLTTAVPQEKGLSLRVLALSAKTNCQEGPSQRRHSAAMPCSCGPKRPSTR